MWRRVILGCVVVLIVGAAPAFAQSGICDLRPITAVVGATTGANAAAIQAGVDTYRASLGADNGEGGSYPTGRREIDWDDVPDDAAAPNTIATNTRYLSRGVVLSTAAAINAYQVSADPNTAPGILPRFGNITSSYASTFQAFSGERIFTPLGTNVLEVRFVMPNTGKPAAVRSFAAVFADVDASGAPPRSNTFMEFYASSGRRLNTVADGDSGPLPITSFNNGLTFSGGVSDCEPIARVRIVLGTTPLSAGVSDGGSSDVVALDNFVYSEPHPIERETLDFDGDGATDIAIYRPSNGGWYVLNSGTNTVTTTFFGQPGDIPVPADYENLGRTTMAVFRPTTAEWWIQAARSPGTPPRSTVFGLPGDIPMPFDYDEDGHADLIQWRPSDGGFYINPTTNPFPSGGYSVFWGQPGDVPLKKQ